MAALIRMPYDEAPRRRSTSDRIDVKAQGNQGAYGTEIPWSTQNPQDLDPALQSKAVLSIKD